MNNIMHLRTFWVPPASPHRATNQLSEPFGQSNGVAPASDIVFPCLCNPLGDFMCRISRYCTFQLTGWRLRYQARPSQARFLKYLFLGKVGRFSTARSPSASLADVKYTRSSDVSRISALAAYKRPGSCFAKEIA